MELEAAAKDENWLAIVLLDRFQFQARCVRKKGLHMVRGRGHLPLLYKTLRLLYGLGPLWRSSMDGSCGRANFSRVPKAAQSPIV